jgi:hypothetical protein
MCRTYLFIYLNGSVLRIYLHLLVHLKDFTDKLCLKHSQAVSIIQT